LDLHDGVVVVVVVVGESDGIYLVEFVVVDEESGVDGCRTKPFLSQLSKLILTISGSNGSVSALI
jgi:hypothetical protein